MNPLPFDSNTMKATTTSTCADCGATDHHKVPVDDDMELAAHEHLDSAGWVAVRTTSLSTLKFTGTCPGCVHRRFGDARRGDDAQQTQADIAP